MSRTCSDTLLVSITCPDYQTAKKIAKTLVEEKLAACVNILASVDSIYRWKGAIEESTESELQIKTLSSAFDALKKRVLELHPYECPCIIGVPIQAGNEAYLEWVRNSVRQ